MLDRLLQSLATVPIVFAVALACLYGLGAGVKAIQLAAAHADVFNGLALIPIDQMLSAGISTLFMSIVAMTAVFVTTLVLAAMIGFREWQSYRRRQTGLIVIGTRSRPDAKTRWEAMRRQWRILTMSYLIVVIVLLPPILAGGMAVAIGALLLFERMMPSIKDRTVRRIGVLVTVYTTLAIAVASFVVDQALYRRPLPDARVVTRSGQAITGRLIVISPEGWFVARNAKSVVSIPLAIVASATVRPRHSHPTPGLGKAVLDWLS